MRLEKLDLHFNDYLYVQSLGVRKGFIPKYCFKTSTLGKAGFKIKTVSSTSK